MHIMSSCRFIYERFLSSNELMEACDNRQDDMKTF